MRLLISFIFWFGIWYGVALLFKYLYHVYVIKIDKKEVIDGINNDGLFYKRKE